MDIDDTHPHETKDFKLNQVECKVASRKKRPGNAT